MFVTQPSREGKVASEIDRNRRVAAASTRTGVLADIAVPCGGPSLPDTQVHSALNGAKSEGTGLTARYELRVGSARIALRCAARRGAIPPLHRHRGNQ